MLEATPLLTDLVIGESPRWHEGRLWFAHWGTGEIVAVDPEGRSEVVGEGPAGLGWSIAWLPDDAPTLGAAVGTGLADAAREAFVHAMSRASIVVATVSEISDPVHEAVVKLEGSGDVEADLRGLARELLRMVMQPRILQLRRLVIGEAGRFPELGRTFYEQGPGRTITALATVFEQLARRGVLRLDDPQLAAAQFNWLVMSIPLNRAMFLGEDRPPARAELNRHADAGVRTFLAGYAQPLPPP